MKRFAYLWWAFAIAVLSLGTYVKAYAQTFGSPQTVITIYASTNPCFTYDVNFTTGLTLVTATASSDLTVSYY